MTNRHHTLFATSLPKITYNQLICIEDIVFNIIVVFETVYMPYIWPCRPTN